MRFDEYRNLDGVALAKLVADGEVTAAELLELAIARAEAVNPALNGLIIPLYDQAREQAAGALSGPLAGVPMLTKDLFQEIGGAPNYQGNKALKRAGHKAPVDSELVRRWKAAGVVLFGRTNTPEFGAKGITEPEAFGATRNPWNTDHTPGGSSGGSAALVAAVWSGASWPQRSTMSGPDSLSTSTESCESWPSGSSICETSADCHQWDVAVRKLAAACERSGVISSPMI